MGFVYQVPPVVGGTVLIIERIQSQNFVTTVSGWAINADGTAEFLNVVVRGTLITGTIGAKHIEINGSDAPQGVAFYTGESDETFPGVIQPDHDADMLSVTYTSPLVAGHSGASLTLSTGRSGGILDNAQFDAEAFLINADILELLGSGGQSIVFDSDGSGEYIDVDAPRIFLRDTAISNTAGAVMEDGDLSRIGETWHTVGAVGQPAFAGNWAVQGGSPVAFFKDATGRVQLRGRGVEAVASSATIFTLPVGYRPTQTMSFPVKSNNDAATISWLSVSTAGAITLIGNVTQGRVQTVLDSVSFPTF